MKSKYVYAADGADFEINPELFDDLFNKKIIITRVAYNARQRRQSKKIGQQANSTLPQTSSASSSQTAARKRKSRDEEGITQSNAKRLRLNESASDLYDITAEDFSLQTRPQRKRKRGDEQEQPTETTVKRARLTLDEDLINKLNKYHISENQYELLLDALLKLKYTVTQINKLILKKSSANMVKVVIAKHDELIKILTHEQIIKIASHDSSSKNLSSVLDCLKNEEVKGYLANKIISIEQIIKIASHAGGSKNLSAVLDCLQNEEVKEYLANKIISIEQIIKITSHDGGSKNLSAVLDCLKNEEFKEYLANKIISIEQIIKIASHGGGSKNLSAVLDCLQNEEVKEYLAKKNISIEQIIKITSSNGGSKNLSAVLDCLENEEVKKYLANKIISIEQIIKIASHIGGSKNLSAMMEYFKKMRATGLTTEQVVKISGSYSGGSAKIGMFLENNDYLRSIGFNLEMQTNFLSRHGSCQIKEAINFLKYLENEDYEYIAMDCQAYLDKYSFISYEIKFSSDISEHKENALYIIKNDSAMVFTYFINDNKCVFSVNVDEIEKHLQLSLDTDVWNTIIVNNFSSLIEILDDKKSSFSLKKKTLLEDTALDIAGNRNLEYLNKNFNLMAKDADDFCDLYYANNRKVNMIVKVLEIWFIQQVKNTMENSYKKLPLFGQIINNVESQLADLANQLEMDFENEQEERINWEEDEDDSKEENEEKTSLNDIQSENQAEIFETILSSLSGNDFSLFNSINLNQQHAKSDPNYPAIELPIKSSAQSPCRCNISDLDKAELLVALYRRAKNQGMGMFFSNYDFVMDTEKAKQILDKSLDIDYINGKILKVCLAGDELDTYLYNRDNGFNAAEDVIQALRSNSEIKKDKWVDIFENGLSL